MKENVMNNPGQYLKSIRKKLGLGVKAVYMQTGVGDSTIRRIEEGTTKFPPAAQLKTLANFYNINLIELYKSNRKLIIFILIMPHLNALHKYVSRETYSFFKCKNS